jgi:hypothetical protein
VVPEVEAPDGSGLFEFVVAGWLCYGWVPEVDGVGDECGELEDIEPLELVPRGEAGAGGWIAGAAGGVGAWAGAGVAGATNVGPNGIEVQLN